LTAMIYGNNLIFNYSTDYVKTHPNIANAKDFKLTDEEYAAFKKYVLEDDFTYSTASEEQLKKIKATIEQEGLDEDAKQEYEALMQKITPSKERDLEKFQDEIKMLLENEIVSRYYYQKGRVLNSFNHDDILKKGVEILKNTQEYNTILKK
jgi:carboxyl-terminal processing protease